MDKQAFVKLREDILHCNLCENDFGFKPHPIVFGNQNAKVMQISQAPSANVHQTLLPFNDASGKKLRNEIYQITEEQFYNPKNFYFVSLAHCYPGKNENKGDRKPPSICSKTWLKKELELVDCKLYLIVGSLAANYFFPKKNFTELVFTDVSIRGRQAFVIPHPSPLNQKWFKEHPEFLQERAKMIQSTIKKVLDKSD